MSLPRYMNINRPQGEAMNIRDILLRIPDFKNLYPDLFEEFITPYLNDLVVDNSYSIFAEQVFYNEWFYYSTIYARTQLEKDILEFDREIELEIYKYSAPDWDDLEEIDYYKGKTLEITGGGFYEISTLDGKGFMVKSRDRTKTILDTSGDIISTKYFPIQNLVRVPAFHAVKIEFHQSPKIGPNNDLKHLFQVVGGKKRLWGLEYIEGSWRKIIGSWDQIQQEFPHPDWSNAGQNIQDGTPFGYFMLTVPWFSNPLQQTFYIYNNDPTDFAIMYFPETESIEGNYNTPDDFYRMIKSVEVVHVQDMPIPINYDESEE